MADWLDFIIIFISSFVGGFVGASIKCGKKIVNIYTKGQKMIDHRKLLKKFMSFLQREEGTDFVDPYHKSNCKDAFTNDEWEELDKLSAEMLKERFQES